MRFLSCILFLVLLSKVEACSFCRQAVIDLQTIFETEHFRVMLDYEPRVKGHLLAVTKRHITRIDEMQLEEWSDLHTIVPKVATVFARFLGTTDYVFLEKNGKGAFQDVPHVHFHFFPIKHEKWGDVFDSIPDRLSRQEIIAEVQTFQEQFRTIETN